MQGTLGIDDNLRNKLHALVEEIHTSLNPRPFEDPLDPACSFHVQREEPIGTQNEAPSSVPRQQEELNAASSILRNLSPAGGPGPAPCPAPSKPGTNPPLPNSIPNDCPYVSTTTTGPSPISTSRATPPTNMPRATDLNETNPPTLISAPLVSMPLRPVSMPQFPRDSPWAPGHPDPLFPPTPLVPCPPQCLIPPLMPTILDPRLLEDPLPLDGPQGPPWVAWVKTPVEDHPMADPLEDGARRWTTFPPSAEMEITTTTTTMPDPHLELKTHRTIPAMHWPRKGIAFDHYTALLRFDPNNSILSNWLAFTQEFSSKFGVFDTVAEAEENLFNLRMRNNECFMTFIFTLHRALPQRIKDVLCLAPKQTTYNGYKALVTQVDQRYWEDRSKNTAPRTSWNTSSNTNWQAGATNGI
ncbi:hypothetical protein C0989_007602 [Termitomyces sp. Mn162]|nr:hypothetical protein C0989_007602 [Termitomyces sp. Mn162]